MEEKTLVLVKGRFFLKDSQGNYYPFQFPTVGSGGGGGRGAQGSSGAQGTQGAQGASGVGGANVESGTFTRTAVEGSGAQIVTTTKKPKLLFFNYIFTSDNAVSGAGISDGINQSCLPNQGNTTFASQADCINIDDGGGGFSAKVLIANITNTSFQVDWTSIGSGEDVTVQWHAITE